MKLKQLVWGGPRNIRKRLFRDIIVIIVITSGILLFITIYRDNTTQNAISSELIQETSQLVKKRFINYLAAYETSLQVIARLGQESVLDTHSNQIVVSLFHQILEVHQGLQQITLVDEVGNYIAVTRAEDNGYESNVGVAKNRADLIESDSFQGALDAPGEQPIYWAKSLTADNREPGLLASIRFDIGKSKKSRVLSYYIPVENIVTFISDIEIARGIDIVLFNEQGLVVSRQGFGIESRVMETTSETSDSALHYPGPKEIVELWQQDGSPEQSSKKFKLYEKTWWAGYTPLNDDNNTTWLAVFIPESAIFENVYRQRIQLGGIVGVIVVIAAALTVNLVRRYSSQLKDLPQHKIINSELIKSIQELINAGESSSVEFKSTIRKNLQTGQSGKEIEIAWLKAVTAFMNSDGGILLIGVDDSGAIVGTEPDGFANEDKCRLHIKNLINTHIGANFARYIHLKLCDFGSETILFLECERVRKPVFLKVGKSEAFYVRSGPSNMKLTMSQMVSYLSAR